MASEPLESALVASPLGAPETSLDEAASVGDVSPVVAGDVAVGTTSVGFTDGVDELGEGVTLLDGEVTGTPLVGTALLGVAEVVGTAVLEVGADVSLGAGSLVPQP